MDGWDQEQEGLLSFREDQHESMDVSARRSLMMQSTWNGDDMRGAPECMPRQFYILVSMEISRDRYITGGG
jgi:hypothetical protein